MKTKVAAIVSLILALIFTFGEARAARAQDQTSYPSMAPLDQYLMERNAEIALARSAAPEAISRDAEVLIPRTEGLRDRRQRPERFRLRGAPIGCSKLSRLHSKKRDCRRSNPAQCAT
jgi:hypothetical protein